MSVIIFNVIKSRALTIKQWFNAPTPKQFFYTSAVHAIGAPLLGIFIAVPFMSALMMFFLLLSLLFTSVFLKDEISWSYNNPMIAISPFILVLMFFLGSTVSYTKIIDDKNQLQQVSGIIPTDNTIRRVAKNRSSALVIDGVWLHCRYSDGNDCKKAYEYAGQTATVLYQADTSIGNVVYDIRVGNQAIYDFETQRAAYKAAQNQERRQWFFMFVLFMLPAYWFYKHNKRLYEVMPKMSGAKLIEFNKQQAEIKKQQKEIADEGGCAMAIGIFMFLTVALCAGLTGLISLGMHKFGMAAVFMFLCVLSIYVIIVLSKPTKSL